MRFRPPVNSRRNIITVHDLNHVYAKKGLSLWWQNMRLTRHLRRAHQLVAITQFVADDIRKHLPWAPPATVIHNGVADLTQVPQEKPPGFALPEGDYLLHISRMSPSKNVGSLIEMAAMWPEQALLLVGPESTEVDKHRAHVSRLGLRNVHFLTDVSEGQKAWLYAHCKAFLFPSLLEGFGLPPIEAMHFGKPVVVARATSLPEVCGKECSYFEGFTDHQMRSVIEGSLSGKVTPKSWLEKYSWCRVAQNYTQEYEKNIHIDAVTVVTADTRRPDLAVRALERCLEKISFFDTIAFTPKNYRYTGHHPIRTVEIEEMKSSADYSNFIVSTLPDFIKTSHVLITQWDGYILNPERWDPEFLEYDYIGATWPQFTDNHNVGNGGFSLRSYKLMKAVREISPPEVDPEDFVICRTLRKISKNNITLDLPRQKLQSGSR